VGPNDVLGAVLAAACVGLGVGHLGALRYVLGKMGLAPAPAKLLSPAVRSRYTTATSEVSAGIAQHLQAIDEAVSALTAYDSVVGDMQRQLSTLPGSVQGGHASVAKATAAQEAIRAHLGGLLEILGRTNTSLEEMVFSSNEVVNGIQNLSRAAEETAASTNEMDVSMAQVQSQANASSELSAKVSQEAELGVTAIKQTVQGIDQIKVNNRLAAEVIERLSQCIEEVSTVLGVIDDVAEQTNLLALNAAIIAAQAGDHGRGFAVVADEIKALAERTGASTKEISDIILRIQEHSRRVTDVVTTGVQDVEAGMQLGQHAQDALHSVVSSAQHSMVMMRGIAQATVEHAKGAKKINSAMGQITETMAQIYYATSEQARGSEVLMGNMATMQKTLEEAQVELGLQAEGHATLAQLCQVLGDKGAAMGTLLGDLAPHQPALGQVRAAAQAGQTLHHRAQELSTLLTDRPKTLRP
jgi:hypothetical protein